MPDLERYHHIRWKCRRGMLELDLILMHFLEHEYQNLNAEQKQVFERLLDEEDQSLYRWFLKQDTPQDKSLAAMVEYINAVKSK